MKSYILDIIPKIQRYSQKLDNLSILLNKHWVLLDEESPNKSVFIFREKNNQLLISINGIIKKGNWEYLGNNSLLIDQPNGSLLYKHGFIDDCILALKVDGKEEYALFVNEQWFEKQLKSLNNILAYLDEKYVEQKEQQIITIPKSKSNQNQNHTKEISRNNTSINNFLLNLDDVLIPQEIKNNIHLDKTFLIYSIKEIDQYIKFFKSKKYPFYAALILDKKNVKLSSELTNNLLKVARRDFRLETINEVLREITK